MGAITNGSDKPPPECLNITTNNTEVILKLEKRVEELEKNAKIARGILNSINKDSCDYTAWYRMGVVKEYLRFEVSEE